MSPTVRIVLGLVALALVVVVGGAIAAIYPFIRAMRVGVLEAIRAVLR